MSAEKGKAIQQMISSQKNDLLWEFSLLILPNGPKSISLAAIINFADICRNDERTLKSSKNWSITALFFHFFCHGGSQYNWINIREKWTSVWGCNAKLPLNAVQLTVSILYSKTKNMYIILWIIQKQHINLCTAPWTLLMEVQRSVCNAWSDY